MSQLQLKAYSRAQMKEQTGNRKMVEAEMYGPGFENSHLAVFVDELEKAFKAGHMATIIDLEVDGKVVPVIIKEIQRGHLKNNPLHVDFYRIKDDQKVHVEVDVTPVGKSFAITNMGGMLVKNTQRLRVECLPKFLVKEIEVDLGKLVNLNQVIRVADLDLPEGITVKNGKRDPIVSVIASRKAKSAAATGPATTPAGGAAPAAAKAPAKKKK
ncbi:MAG: 50S ribosomal protein L25 [Candidatus Falkowbacteria bacterium]